MKGCPGIGPRSCMPVLVQRKARDEVENSAYPTSTEPSALAAAPIEVSAPLSVPRLCMPPADVQRKARLPETGPLLPLVPTATLPSALTPPAKLRLAPFRVPRLTIP